MGKQLTFGDLRVDMTSYISTIFNWEFAQLLVKGYRYITEVTELRSIELFDIQKLNSRSETPF